MQPSEDEGPARILIVDDDEQVTRSLAQWLDLSGFLTAIARSADEAETVLTEGEIFDAVISDVRMPGRDGLDFLRALRRRDPDLPVVMLSGHADIPMAVEALKAGAFDFLTKPADPERVVTVLRNAATQARLARRVSSLEARLSEPGRLESRLVGHSAAMTALRAEVAAIAALPIDVIVLGETGVGKEVVAEALHACGPRPEARFVAVNCAAVPADIFESELFGHETGAFTGARQARVGKIEYASGGTLFLDEIESMPLAAQGKILRVLQERCIERLGSNRRIPVDIRVVAATKVDLRQASTAGLFRPDLYYRLAGVEIHIPALRARPEDIPLLFAFFASRMAERAARKAAVLAPEEIAALLTHDWPGNVRELRTAAERFALGLGLSFKAKPGTETGAVAGGSRSAFPAEVSPEDGLEEGLPERVAVFEAGVIRAALATTGSAAAAAEMLHIPRRTLNEKMQRYRIRRDQGLDPSAP